MITELKQTNLIAVEVPKSAMKYILASYNNNGYYSNDLYYATTESLFNNVCFPASESKIKILGEVTKDKIGFDFEPYVGKELKSVGYVWMDYTLYDFEDTDKGNVVVYEEKRPYKFDEAEDSFYSLLVANGLYFENPMDAWYTYTTEEDCDKWQQIEDNLIKGKILILEKL